MVKKMILNLAVKLRKKQLLATLKFQILELMFFIAEFCLRDNLQFYFFLKHHKLGQKGYWLRFKL
jgi:hypothetical protein